MGPLRTIAVPKESKPFRFKWRVLLVILACIIGVGLISRFALIDNSLRLDESQSLWQTSHSVSGTLRVVASDVHVPLYHMLLHFWQLYFGNSVQTARLMSLLFFVITIPVFYLLARRILSVNWSLFAVAIFSFSPFMNWYANEARMYTLLALFAILSQYFYLKLIQEKKGWIGYALTALVGVYAHYFFFFALLTQAIFFLFNSKRFGQHAFKRMVLIGAAVVAAFAPWFLYFRSLGSGKSFSPALSEPTTFDLFNAFSQFAFGFQTQTVNTILVSMWPVLVVVALLAVKRKQKLDSALMYIVAASFLPIILAFVFSLFAKPFFISRYMITCMPPLIILSVWFISNYRRRFAGIIAAVLFAGALSASFIQATNAQTPVKEDYRQVVADISKNATPSDLVVLSTPFTLYPFEYYYQGAADIETLPRWDGRSAAGIPQFDKLTLPSDVDTLNKGHRYIYLVLSYDQGYESDVYDYYNKHFKQVAAQKYSKGLAVYTYQVGYNLSTPLSQMPDNLKVTADSANATQ